MAHKKDTKSRPTFIMPPGRSFDAGPDAPGITWRAEVHMEQGDVVYIDEYSTHEQASQKAQAEADEIHRDAVESRKPHMGWEYIRIIRVAPKG